MSLNAKIVDKEAICLRDLEIFNLIFLLFSFVLSIGAPFLINLTT